MTTETKTKLEELLAKARAAAEAKRADYEARSAAAQAQAQHELDEAVATVRDLVEPALGRCDIDGKAPHLGGLASLVVKPAVWKGLVQLVVHQMTGAWRVERVGSSDTFFVLRHSAAEWETVEALEFLAATDNLFQERRDQAVVWQTANMATTRSETVARETHAELLKLDETRAEEWDALLAAALDRIAAHAEVMDAYVQALGEWRRKYERILNENRKTAEGAQRALDEEFERYEVAFAAVGDDDDEPYRETVWAIEPDPAEGGYWSIFENGNIVRRRLLRPLWVGEAIIQTLSEAGAGPWRRSYYVHDAGMTVYYLPWGKVELHRRLDRAIEPLPAEPTPPQELRDRMTAAEQARINEVTRGMASVEIPF